MKQLYLCYSSRQHQLRSYAIKGQYRAAKRVSWYKDTEITEEKKMPKAMPH
jgi:hypothetical protein